MGKKAFLILYDEHDGGYLLKMFYEYEEFKNFKFYIKMERIHGNNILLS